MLVLADVHPGAVDLDLGVVAEPFILLTPAESAVVTKKTGTEEKDSGHITPFTTLVSMEIIETGKSIAAAEQSVIVKWLSTNRIGHKVCGFRA